MERWCALSASWTDNDLAVRLRRGQSPAEVRPSAETLTIAMHEHRRGDSDVSYRCSAFKRSKPSAQAFSGLLSKRTPCFLARGPASDSHTGAQVFDLHDFCIS
jgi:hypothetical protein